MNAPLVVKVGGSELARPGFAEELAAAVAGHRAVHPVILVHGGGREIDAMLARLGLGEEYVDGQRVTDPATLEVVEMMLSGRLNKRLVRTLLAAGVDALGLSGVDRGLIRAEPLGGSGRMGRVGRVRAVRGELLLDLCRQGVVPVISPVSLGNDGAYNVNADHAATAVAAAVGAERLVLLTDVPGVLTEDGLLEHLSPVEAGRLIDAGVIRGGMIPKVRGALDALEQGVAAAVICNLAGFAEPEGSGRAKGTMFTPATGGETPPPTAPVRRPLGARRIEARVEAP